MSEGVLKFNLPEEECEFKIASRAMDWALVVLDLDDELRNRIKYGESDEITRKEDEEIRATLRELLEQHKLLLEDIV